MIEVGLSIRARGTCIKRMTKAELKNKSKHNNNNNNIKIK